MIVALLGSVGSLSIELARLFSIKENASKKVARIVVRITTMSRLERDTGFLVRRRMGVTDIPVAAAQSRLMKMFEKNIGQKSGNNLKEQTKRLPSPEGGCASWTAEAGRVG